jgi:hypothetical protein
MVAHRTGGAFVTTFREMLELRYLWRVPLHMDNAHLEAVIGAEPHTPLDQAVEATLMGLGCLDASETRSPEHSLNDGTPSPLSAPRGSP